MANPNPWQARQQHAVNAFLRQLERDIDLQRQLADSEPYLFGELEDVRRQRIDADAQLLADLKSDYLRGSDA